MTTSLQKAIVMELLNVTKAEEGQKKMIFGRPFHYAGSKWVPDKAGPKEETSKERSKKTEEPEKEKNRQGKRDTRGHIGESKSVSAMEKDLISCAKKSKFPLTSKESKKIVGSVLDYTESTTDFRKYQQGLREDKDFLYNSPEEIKRKVDSIESLFKFYPIYKGDNDSKIYRGIGLDSKDGWSSEKILATFNKGGYVSMKGLSSWSSDENVADGFLTYPRKSPERYFSIVFECKNKSGVSIEALSDARGEKEVLHSSGSRWKVLDLKPVGHRKNEYKIQLEEI